MELLSVAVSRVSGMKTTAINVLVVEALVSGRMPKKTRDLPDFDGGAQLTETNDR